MVPRTQTRTTPQDVMRGVAGAVLLGGPLLYTQEIWDHGRALDPLVVLAQLFAAFVLSAALSYYVGFRHGRTHRPFEDAVVGAGTGILLSFLLLLVLGRISFAMPASSIFGTIALTASPAMIGFAIGNALAPEQGGAGAKRMRGGRADLLAAAGGAIVLALNIAPTEEPIRLAQELTWLQLALLVGLSLALPYLIVFEAEFGGREDRRAHDGATQRPSTETLLAYVVAFLLSALMLWSFGRVHRVDLPSLAAVVSLGFPASLGAALGRMLV
jgi:putative integral membrane protein (TIGR02587 family)